MPYAFKHEGKVYGPDGPIKDMDGHELQPSDADNYNKGLEAIELEEWKLQPDTWLAYYIIIRGENGLPVLGGAFASTWLGTSLGRITSAHIYRHNFGSQMISIEVEGTNGATYYGRASYDWGSCVKLHKHKSRKR